MNDQVGSDLRDAELLDEIRLVGELMVLATESPGLLDQDSIDAILDVPAAVEGDAGSIPGQRGHAGQPGPSGQRQRFSAPDHPLHP